MPTLAPFDALPGARVERLTDAGHTPIWEQPELTAQLILSAVSAAGAAMIGLRR